MLHAFGGSETGDSDLQPQLQSLTRDLSQQVSFKEG